MASALYISQIFFHCFGGYSKSSTYIYYQRHFHVPHLFLILQVDPNICVGVPFLIFRIYFAWKVKMQNMIRLFFELINTRYSLLFRTWRSVYFATSGNVICLIDRYLIGEYTIYQNSQTFSSYSFKWIIFFTQSCLLLYPFSACFLRSLILTSFSAASKIIQFLSLVST